MVPESLSARKLTLCATDNRHDRPSYHRGTFPRVTGRLYLGRIRLSAGSGRVDSDMGEDQRHLWAQAGPASGQYCVSRGQLDLCDCEQHQDVVGGPSYSGYWRRRLDHIGEYLHQ